MSRAVWHRLSLGCALAAAVAATLGCVVDYQLGSEREAVTVRVLADRAWTDTGVDVLSGEQLQIDYLHGQWSPWPGDAFDALGFGGDPRCDCNQMAGVSHAALIGRIGDGEPFFVGDHWLQGAGTSGRLYLGINDTRLSDNTGWLEVFITPGG
jgi:hypothetical protein